MWGLGVRGEYVSGYRGGDGSVGVKVEVKEGFLNFSRSTVSTVSVY